MSHFPSVTAKTRRLVLLRALVFFAYGLGLWYLGTDWWKALLIGVGMTILFTVGMGGRWIARGALILLLIVTLVWIEVIPKASQWKQATTEFVRALQN